MAEEKDLGILVIHGMGTHKKGYADEMIEDVTERLSGGGARIAWEPVLWSDILDGKETDLWDRLSKDHDLDYVKLRKFVIHSLGDAVAYRYLPSRAAGVYMQIHDRVFEHIKRLHAKLGGKSKPLVVMAHSLGSVILSNYIWDKQNALDKGRYGDTPFQCMETLCCLITFGSNIPIFSLAHDPVESIEFPPQKLGKSFPPESVSKVGRVARWLNFYDPDDVLGYPLKPLYRKMTVKGKRINEVNIEDFAINAGGIFTSWNPMSHGAYWTDEDFIATAAEAIGAIIDIL